VRACKFVRACVRVRCACVLGI